MPRALKLLPTFALFAFFALVSPCVASALARQAPEARDPEFDFGVSLYKLGDYKGAAGRLRAVVKRSPADHAAWLLLGKALVARGELKDARKAFEKAVKLKPDSAAAHAGLAHALLLADKAGEAEAGAAKALALDPFLSEARHVVGLLRLREGEYFKARDVADTILKFDPDFAPAHSLKMRTLFGAYGIAEIITQRFAHNLDETKLEAVRAEQLGLLKEAAESLEVYVRLTPNAPDAAALREELEALRFHDEANASGDPSRRIYTARTPGLTPARIRSKPEPGFTDEARDDNVTGVVRLRAVLGADGGVKHVTVVKGLSHGLTEKAVAAARKIKFNPATLGGRPVSQYVLLDYNFNIY